MRKQALKIVHLNLKSYCGGVCKVGDSVDIEGCRSSCVDNDILSSILSTAVLNQKFQGSIVLFLRNEISPGISQT